LRHLLQGKLTGADTALARWLVYAHTHVDLPLDYRVFLPILEKLRYAIATNLFLQEEVRNQKPILNEYIIFHFLFFVAKTGRYIVNTYKQKRVKSAHLFCLKYLLIKCGEIYAGTIRKI